MARYLPIGFHCGPGGSAVGIGKPAGYMPQLDAAGLPFGIISADDHGVIGEACAYDNADHVRVFRLTKYDVPVYTAAPADAARIMWQGLLASLPPEFDPRKTWLAVINEPDRELADWLGEFGYEIGQLALRDGYNVALFGWSTGTPEVDAWYTPGMVKFLRLAGENPDRIAVALHEYSLSTGNILEGYPYLVGRFGFLHDACDDQNIPRPTIIIKELGWTYNAAPGKDVAMADLKKVADIYAPHENVIHSGVWWLGGGYGDIYKKIQPLIAPTTTLALNYTPPPVIPPPPAPPQETFEEYFWRRSIERQVISANPAAMLQKTMIADGFMWVENEEWDKYVEVGGKSYAYQAGEDPTGKKPRRVYMAEVPAAGQPWVPFYITDPKNQPPIEPPPGKIVLTHWPTDYQVVTQNFGANPQNYEKYGYPGHNGIDLRSPLGSPYYAAISGVVEWVSNYAPAGGLSDYGWHIRVRTGKYLIIYAHAAPNPPVAVGDIVAGGQVIAFSGNTGNSTGAHLHFEMRNCDYQLAGWPYCIIDPTPYIQPLLSAPAPNLIDMAPYFQVVPDGVGPFFVLQHSNGTTEDIQHQIAGGEVFIVKNAQYERLRVTGQYIERREDTSHGGGVYYTLDDGYGWSRWCPKSWKPGDSFMRQPTVRYYRKDNRKDNCLLMSESPNVVSWLRFVQHYPSWTSPSSNASPGGITLSNVAHMVFSWSNNGPPIEQYWFAKNIGLVQWKNDQGDHSWISELPQGRAPLKREVVNCL